MWGRGLNWWCDTHLKYTAPSSCQSPTARETACASTPELNTVKIPAVSPTPSSSGCCLIHHNSLLPWGIDLVATWSALDLRLKATSFSAWAPKQIRRAAARSRASPAGRGPHAPSPTWTGYGAALGASPGPQAASEQVARAMGSAPGASHGGVVHPATSTLRTFSAQGACHRRRQDVRLLPQRPQKAAENLLKLSFMPMQSRSCNFSREW